MCYMYHRPKAAIKQFGASGFIEAFHQLSGIKVTAVSHYRKVSGNKDYCNR